MLGACQKGQAPQSLLFEALVLVLDAAARPRWPGRRTRAGRWRARAGRWQTPTRRPRAFRSGMKGSNGRAAQSRLTGSRGAWPRELVRRWQEASGLGGCMPWRRRRPGQGPRRPRARQASPARPAPAGSFGARLASRGVLPLLAWAGKRRPQAVRDGCVGLRARQGVATVSAAGRRSGYGRASHGRAVWSDTHLMPRFRVGRGGHGSLLQARIRE